MKNRLFVLIAILLPSLALAQEAHEAAHEAATDGIPTFVWLQFANFGLYVVLLVYLLHKPIRAYFKTRQEAFRQALIRAKAAKHQAEQRKTEIQERLTALESSAGETVRQARAEAEAIRSRIVKEASELSQNMRNEAARSAQFEIERAKRELREELLHQGMALSSRILTEKMADPDQKRLQTEFVEKIQVVS